MAELAAVEQARKRAVNFGEDLVEDMVLLDSLSSLTPEEKSTRKVTLAGIDALLQDVDAAKARLAASHRKLDEKLKALQAEERAEQDRQAQARAQQTQAPQAAKAQAAKPELDAGMELWEQLRLPLTFHASEARNQYVLTATCPGLDVEDLKLELDSDGSTLKVQGIRLPSKQDLDAMLVRIARNRRPATAQAVLEMGQGNFGRFQERFQMPEDAQAEAIDASYRDGILRIIIPKHTSPAHTATFGQEYDPRAGRYLGGRTARHGLGRPTSYGSDFFGW